MRGRIDARSKPSATKQGANEKLPRFSGAGPTGRRPPTHPAAICRGCCLTARWRRALGWDILLDMDPEDPADLAEPGNWTGGWYELAIELGQRDDERLGRALTSLWNLAGIEDCKVLVSPDPYRLVDSALTTAALEQQQLRGAVRVPNGHKVVCAVTTVARGQRG